MTDKEMIEEMAKDFLEIDVYDDDKCKDCSRYICNDKCDNDCFAKLCAKYFYNLHYRKIPEGSVVLDRHEHQKYSAYKIIEPQIKGCLDRERELEKQIAELEEQRDRQAYIAEDLIQEKHRWTEQARKETAKEILNGMLDGEIGNKYPCKVMSIERYYELAKQYGVEVEE